MKTHLQNLFLRISLICSLFLAPVLVANAKKNAILTPYDSLSLKGEVATLKVKVEQDKLIPFRPDLKNVFVEFFHKTQFLGLAKTDDNGLARFNIDTRSFEGSFQQVNVRLQKNPEYFAQKRTLQIHLWESDQPIIVTDIDQTISDVENANVVLRPIYQQSPFEGSQNVLTELKRRGHQLVYLTAREDALFQLTKAWLEFHQFPKGHLIMWDIDLLGQKTPWNHGEYKTAALAELKQKFPVVLAAFGDKPHDIKAYQDNDIEAYLMRSRHNENVEFPIGTKEFRSWSSLWDILSL